MNETQYSLEELQKQYDIALKKLAEKNKRKITGKFILFIPSMKRIKRK